MTTPEATRLLGYLLAAFPTQTTAPPTQALYLAYLCAVPWRDGRTEAALLGLIAGRAEPHLPAIGAVLAAVGVAEGAVPLLVEAVRTRRELVVDLSARSGWAVGEAATPVPVVLPALLAGDEPRPAESFTEEERRANLRRLGGLVREMGGRGRAS